jgi:hypothetical protein
MPLSQRHIVRVILRTTDAQMFGVTTSYEGTIVAAMQYEFITCKLATVNEFPHYSICHCASATSREIRTGIAFATPEWSVPAPAFVGAEHFNELKYVYVVVLTHVAAV